MIGYLSGKLIHISPDNALLDVHGVGYRVFLPPRILENISGKPSISLWIHTHVRDDAFDLFGFLHEEELRLFKLLISVSGIGPKTALSILNFAVPAIKHAVVIADVDFFTAVPRLGKKNAQKIIIELKTKLGSIEELNLGEEIDGTTQEVIEALTSMGFSRWEIKPILGKLPEHAQTVSAKIREALKLLGRNQ